MDLNTTNPTTLAAGRVGTCITGLVTLDAQLNSASQSYAQAVIGRRHHLQPVIARLICDLAGIGGRAR